MNNTCIKMNLSAAEEKEIFNFLKLQNCCLRCCFRFIGYRMPECYQDPVEFAKRMGYISEEDNCMDDIPCVVCLGILQKKVQEITVQKIQSKIEQLNYDCETFACALTVPVSLPIRERLLYSRCITELHFSEHIAQIFKVKIQNAKDVWKWIVIPRLEKVIKKRGDLILPSPLLIEIFFTYEFDDKECQALLNVNKGSNNTVNWYKRKHKDNKFSRKNMETLMAEITDDQFIQYFDTSIINLTPTSVCVENIGCLHSSVFIGGRYNKLSRELSQTPWFINGEKKMETSVQDILCNPIAQTVKAKSIKFLSSGREDVDVRTIYSGRPFAVELIDPRMTKITKELLADLANRINQSSKLAQITSNLKVLTRLDLKKLKEGENVKTKFYRALCICRTASKRTLQLEDLNNLKRVRIIQKTPVRVLHRRPLTPRERLIYEMRARWAKPEELKRLLNTAAEDDSRFFVLDIKTQAGTYVKEFVHGDFGRTKPSLCDLLDTEIDIVALDVTGINIKWP